MKHAHLTRNASPIDLVHTTHDIRDRLSSALALVDEIAVPHRPASTNVKISEQAVRAILVSRRQRRRYFDSDLFADPAWDILLELFAAELGQRRMTVSNVAESSGVPVTTALRWIKMLEVRGLLVRTNDRFDGRRVFLSLSPDAVAKMTDYFGNTALDRVS